LERRARCLNNRTEDNREKAKLIQSVREREKEIEREKRRERGGGV